MSTREQFLADAKAAKELEAYVTDEKDRKDLAEMRTQISDERAETLRTLGHDALVQTNDGTIVAKHEVEQAVAAQHDPSGPVNGGAHSAN